MKIWITSDTHLDHRNIIRYCDRPFNSVEEMNEAIIKNWNERVGKDDLVIHLGDFCKGDAEKIKEFRNKLNGIIILILGNHDFKVNESCGFIIVNGSLVIGDVIFSHEPIPLEEIPHGMVCVHGHIHEKKSYSGINVSVERIDYKPIELNGLVFMRE